MARHAPTIDVDNELFLAVPLAVAAFFSVSLLVFICARRRAAKSVDAGSGEPPSGGGAETGVWQKAILMGEKCNPPEFSGVIYYDYAGNRVPEMPRSPRPGTHSNPFGDFSFYLEKDDGSKSIVTVQ